MYMSGRPCSPLSISLAAKCPGNLTGSSGSLTPRSGLFNIDRIVDCGVWPVTVATTILKTGGYQRFSQMAEKIMAKGVKPWTGIDVDALEKLAEDAKKDKHH